MNDIAPDLSPVFRFPFEYDAFDQERERLGRPSCRVCGCSDSTPCEGGCWWWAPDLCSSCAGLEIGGTRPRPFLSPAEPRQVA